MTDLWHLIEEGRDPSPATVSDVVAQEAVRLGRVGVRAAQLRLAENVLGAGSVQHLLDDPTVTDVLVNGCRGVWVDRGRGLERAGKGPVDPPTARRLAVRLAALAGRRLDDAAPYVDGLLPGGVRLHAVLPPLVDDAAHISLRVPRRIVPTLDELVGWGSIPETWREVFTALVASRTSFLITGGAGTGKTTLLAALLGSVEPGHRIVIVEDVRELVVDHPHVVRLQSRPANVEERGAVGLVTLVRQSLRMRPDRLVVGEVRGAEVRELLAALNTGHEGGCGTLHANGTADVVARVEALGALAGLSPEATRTQLVSAVRVVVHLRRRAGLRLVEAIGVLSRSATGAVEVRPALLRGDEAATCARVNRMPSEIPEPAARLGGEWAAGEEPGDRLLRGPGWPLLASCLGWPAEVSVAGERDQKASGAP
ncbi:MAG TPA: TadA family conjugal transfer-associated ATPase [Dermatophilaceae bacterium]|nr:TadA family conjugal transfer-associated ATPase [Dermatophilaceae bacterium]